MRQPERVVYLKKFLLNLCILAVLATSVYAVDPFGVELSRVGTGTNLIVTVQVKVPLHHHLYADQFRVESESGRPLILLNSNQAVMVRDAFSEEVLASYTNDVVLHYRAGAPLAAHEALKVSYQGCDESQCFFPVTRIFPGTAPAVPIIERAGGKPDAVPGASAGWRSELAGLTPVATASGYLNTKDFLSFLNRADGIADVSVGSTSLSARIKVAFLLFSTNPLEFFKLYGMWWTVLIILVGGLLLNLTPCVLPMIPINLAIIGVGAQNGTKLKGIILGSAYGLGIALVYGLLGVVVVLTGSQFGMLNSMPWFNAVIGLVFVLLALAMFDVFSIDMTRFQRAGTGGETQGKVVTAVFMGGVSALLAGACVAPVVIAVLLLSSNLFAQGAWLGLILPFLLGAGMALPWPFAGAGLSFLPKPGAWMVWVKTGFGILILLFALYYFALAYQGWWGTKERAIAEAGVHQISGVDPAEWKAVAEAASSQGKPVFIDFWATWCKNCEAMDLTTFRDSAVKERLAGYIVVKFQAEDLSDKGIRDVADFFGVKGLPTYVVLKAGGATP